MASVANIKIEPSDVKWEIEEQTLVKTVADVSDSLDGKYFTLSNGGDSTKYYVWFNSSVGVAADPAPAGRTAIEVAFDPNDSAATIASKLQAAVDAVGAFGATVSGDEVTITNAAVGDSEDVVDVDTGFTFTKCQDGGEHDLGFIEGDIEITTEVSTFDVTAHQTGESLLASLVLGTTAELGTTLLETSETQFKELLGKGAGGSFTPSGGTAIHGMGTSKVGTNAAIQARRLILHPRALAASDKSRDLCFWKGFPLVDSIVKSGTNPNTIAVTWRCFQDESKPEAIRLFAFGDHSQAGITA